MARGAVRRHGEALQGTHRKGREPFGNDLRTGHHERTHGGAAERPPRHNHAPRPADSPTAVREPQDAATTAPSVARKYSSTNSLTKQRHTVTGPCQQPAM